mgnify:CR=1 FL=1
MFNAYELDLVLMNGADVKGGMQAQELFSEELLIAVPQLSPLNEKAVWAEGSRYRYLDLKWLNGQNVILPYPGQSLRADVEAVLKSEGITLGRIETIRNIEMAMQMVAANGVCTEIPAENAAEGQAGEQSQAGTEGSQNTGGQSAETQSFQNTGSGPAGPASDI